MAETHGHSHDESASFKCSKQANEQPIVEDEILDELFDSKDLD